MRVTNFLTPLTELENNAQHKVVTDQFFVKLQEMDIGHDISFENFLNQL